MLLNALFPRQCTICQTRIAPKEDENLCNTCKQQLVLPLKKCIFCDTLGAFLCHLCKKENPKLQKIHICYRYESIIQTLIQQYKFSLRPYLGRTIARLMWQQSLNFFAELPIETIMMPMPSGRLRMAKRGFNPAAIITQHLSIRSDLTYCDNYLSKRAFSIPQTELSREKRLHNLQNSFFIRKRAPRLPNGSSILLIDDVLTTGRTFQQAIRKIDNSCTAQIFGLFIAQS